LLVMERAAWTDERLDDLAEAMRTGFGRLDQGLRDQRSENRSEFAAMRTEMLEGFAAVRGEMREEFAAVRGEMRGEFGSLRGEINELRRVMLGVGGGILVALIGVIAAILARGA
jgi:hypothetical protein